MLQFTTKASGQTDFLKRFNGIRCPMDWQALKETDCLDA